jgi:hypothetical protein
MPRSVEELVTRIGESTRPGYRARLVARGLARNLIWSGGILPRGSPEFSTLLSTDLLSYGLALFELGLELHDLDRNNTALRTAFERAGEAIESVIRDGDPSWNDRGFYTLVASAAYHLGHFSARAFSLFPSEIDALNLSPAERALTLLLRRDLGGLRTTVLDWVTLGGGFDATLANRFESLGSELDFDAALTLSLNSLFHRALAFFDYALDAGSFETARDAVRLLEQGIGAAAEFRSVPFWWIFTIARHLLDDLWAQSLHVGIPDPSNDHPSFDWHKLRRLFIAKLQRRDRAEIDLWPSQVAAAARAVDLDDDLIAALPTSAGKTRIAEICILRSLSVGSRVIFVTPLRALSAQTERNLRRTFASLGFSVSSLYGSSGTTGEDADSLSNRDIVVTTPEKLDFALRSNPSLIDDVGLVVLDEAHTIGAGEREIRYEVLIQRLLRRSDAQARRIVCLSAILPQGEQLEDFVSWIRQDHPGEAISLNWRPTRQRFGEILWVRDRARLTFRIDGETPYVDPFITNQPPRGMRKKPFPSGSQELTFASAWRLVEEGQSVLIYCPQRRSVNALAGAALRLNRQGYLQPLLIDISILNDALNIGQEWLGQFHPAVECLKLGIAVHHAQLPRPFLRAVEQLLIRQVLRVTIASPTLAQGLNLSATTLLFYSLIRGRSLISGEEFANVVGRAGRAFVDVEGQVLYVATARKQLSAWSKVLTTAKERDLRSGLFQLVLGFCQRLAEQKGYSLEQVLEYVTGMMSWDPPRPPRIQNGERDDVQEEFERRWHADLASLDTALLSLVQHDVPPSDLAEAVDRALESSLWQRTLAREDEITRSLSRAILLERSNFVWNNSTAAQRKGYFFSGLSFTTSRFLDEHEDALTQLLMLADTAFAIGNLDEAIESVLRFAEIIFQIEPFKPEKLPEDWRRVLKSWVLGESVSDLAGGKQAEVLEFIEGALVYRLVWALEAARVRNVALTDGEQTAEAGRAALAIETGTPDLCAALLIQSGVPSRIAAIRAIRDCPASFHDFRGLRHWLGTPDVVRKQSDTNWPTPETAQLWRAFVSGLENPAIRKWDVHEFELPVVWVADPPPVGSPVRIVHDVARHETTIYSVDLERIGYVSAPLSKEPAGVMIATVTSVNRISGQYLGPPDVIVT